LNRSEDPEVLTIRGHTLLCLQGFRGEGYSPSFIDNLARIHRRLQDTPETPVRAVVRPDAICDSCPHLGPFGCQLKGERFEREMRAQDREVLRRLAIGEGQVLAWREILKKIASSLGAGVLPEICGSCRWLPLGYCQEGIDRLRRVGLK